MDQIGFGSLSAAGIFTLFYYTFAVCFAAGSSRDIAFALLQFLGFSSLCSPFFFQAPTKATLLMAFAGVRLSLRMLCIIGFITYQVNRLLGISVFCTFDFPIYPVGLCNIIKTERAAVLQAARSAA